MSFQYNPVTGLMDTTVYPTKPTSETAARQQFMDLFNQVGDELNAQKANYVSPTGTADDTSYLQSAFDTYPVVVLKEGIYYVNAVTRLNIPSNIKIVFQPGAVLQAKTSASDSYRVVYINNVENVTIINPTVIGERSTHVSAGGGDDGHGICIQGTSYNVRVYNPVCKDCWGDGFTIYGGENIYVENLFADNNRRMGLTITNGKRITIMNPILQNSNGASPEAGFDIEPNTTTDEVQNIQIINPVTKNNNGAAGVVALYWLANSTHNVSITITDHKDDGSNYGFYLNKLPQGTAKITGKIVNRDPVYMNNKLAGIRVDNYAAVNTPMTEILNPTIINPNASGNASPRFGSGIVILREVAALETTAMGNVLITQPDIRDTLTVPKIVNGIYVFDDKGAACQKVFIMNPVAIDGAATVRERININMSGVVVRDDNYVTAYDPGASYTLSSRVYSRLSNLGASAMAIFTLDTGSVLIDSPITFTVRLSVGLRIVPSSTMSIRPTSTVNGKYMESTEVGASITIRKISSTQWIIEKMIGTWTVEP